MRFLKLNLAGLIIFLLLNINLFAEYNRVVLLAPAIGDIFIKLNLQQKVVGVTKHLKGFSSAKKVGSHLRPNIEIIKSLHPDLIIISSNRFFSKVMQKSVKADIFNYNPHTLDGILRKIKMLGKMFNQEELCKNLINQLQAKLLEVKKLKSRPKVVYEIMQLPYIVSGKTDIINDIIAKAGGINIVTINKKHVKYSPEKVLASKPDIYFYQIGPMNKNPVPPAKRKIFKNLNAKFIKIEEKSFARPNTISFDNVLKLNKIFLNWSNN